MILMNIVAGGPFGRMATWFGGLFVWADIDEGAAELGRTLVLRREAPQTSVTNV